MTLESHADDSAVILRVPVSCFAGIESSPAAGIHPRVLCDEYGVTTNEQVYNRFMAIRLAWSARDSKP